MIIKEKILFHVYLCLLFLIGTELSAQIKIKAVGDVMLGSVTPKEILPPKKGLEFADIGYVLVSGSIAMAATGDELLQHPDVGRLPLEALTWSFGPRPP